MLPTFLVIGAQKAGSSSLWQYLRCHPEIFMTLRAEPSYFSGHNLGRGLDWYEQQFQGAEGYPVCGECSPGYTMYPTFTGVPKRISSLIPDVRLIYLIRHPVKRMRSHYQHRFAAGVERAPIERALRDDPHYLNPSRYAFQIEQYMQHFTEQQLLVVLSEDLRADRRSVLRRIFGFLEVDQDWWSADLEQEFNVTQERLLRRPIVNRVMSSDIALRVAERVPERAKRPIRTMSHRPPPTPPRVSISPELEQELEDRLRDDVARLRAYLPPDFDGWGIA